MASKALDQAQEEHKMDMTPMIDVVFLLIIFFLCIDFKILEAKLPAHLPKDKGSQDFEVEPIEQLSVVIVCDNVGTKRYRNREGDQYQSDPFERVEAIERAYQLQNHQIHWQVGPRSIDTAEDLRLELEKVHEDRSTWHEDEETGEMKPMPIVIEPMDNVMYADVAQTVDAIHAAVPENGKEFEINFGGGRGDG